jgi:hypothetical protein
MIHGPLTLIKLHLMIGQKCSLCQFIIVHNLFLFWIKFFD